MARSNISTSFITPVNAAGTIQTPGAAIYGRGTFLLVTGTTYYFPLGGQDATAVSAHVRWDSDIIIDSITVEDCNYSEDDVSNYADDAGDWIDEDPSTAFVGSDGAGVTATNGVIAVAGGAAGGCMFHMDGTGARRTRVKVVVGGTGGYMKISGWSKE